MLIGGIYPYSKVVTLICKFLRNFMTFYAVIFFKFFWPQLVNFFYVKAVNTMILKNNTFHPL